ncbi:MAG: hypothetical protein R3B41_02300 [Candidatus Doudnabacteria bacterium]
MRENRSSKPVIYKKLVTDDTIDQISREGRGLEYRVIDDDEEFIRHLLYKFEELGSEIAQTSPANPNEILNKLAQLVVHARTVVTTLGIPRSKLDSKIFLQMFEDKNFCKKHFLIKADPPKDSHTVNGAKLYNLTIKDSHGEMISTLIEETTDAAALHQAQELVQQNPGSNIISLVKVLL